MSLLVSDPDLRRTADGELELSATIGWERLWFRVPGDWPLEVRGDAFAVAALPLAMRIGEPLELDPSLPVSGTLLDNLHRVMAVFRLWGPALRQPFHVVPIEAERAAAASASPVVVSWFSGGIDGLYSLIEAPVPVTHAGFIRGIDMQLDNPMYESAHARNAAWLAQRGVPLLRLASNVRFVGHAFHLGWNSYFGAGLSAFGHVLGAGTVIMASGHTWRELWADGSHPLTDPFWSSERTRIVHHGREAKRWEKLDRVAREPGVLELVRVCWQDRGYNCGECEKCLRTMILLRILGLPAPSFPPLSSLRAIARLRPEDKSEACFVEEALALAEARGDLAAAKALRTSLGRWQRRQLASRLRRILRG
jgi:hypothetical protein